MGTNPRIVKAAIAAFPRHRQHVQDPATGTRVTITERGEIYNPIFRFVARFFLGYTATMDATLRALSTQVSTRAG
jgi:hypothetical protein